jgi:hypothetical protein
VIPILLVGSRSLFIFFLWLGSDFLETLLTTLAPVCTKGILSNHFFCLHEVLFFSSVFASFLLFPSRYTFLHRDLDFGCFLEILFCFISPLLIIHRIGPCKVEQYDVITQTTHYEFLCPTQYDAVWNFACTRLPEVERGRPIEWYTVCGTPHTNYTLWMGVFLSILIAALELYVVIFRGTTIRNPSSPKTKVH